MTKKPNRALLSAWHSLRDELSHVEESQPYSFLNSIKFWINKNQQLIGDSFTDGHGALESLLQGKAMDFPMQQPQQATQHLKHLILDGQVPIDLEKAAQILELAICEFAVYTKLEDCPICHEGYLGYWYIPELTEFMLSCPECGWEQDLVGQKWITKYTTAKPATKKELMQLNIHLD